MPQYCFGSFSLDTETRSLIRGDESIPISGKTLDTLILLVESHGRLVSKDELLSQVWSGSVVEEANLSQTVFALRKILGDTPKDHRYIATITGRGYQFVAPVTRSSSEPRPAANLVPQSSRRNGKILTALIALAIAAPAAWWVVRTTSRRMPTELVERRLTFNSSANALVSSELSPDGRFLAYSDRKGIHVRLLSSGEERLIPTPEPVAPGTFLFVDAWFRDGAALLVHSGTATERGNLWSLSVMGQASRELRTEALGWSISPDGTRVAFSPRMHGNDAIEIWVMDFDGSNPHQLIRFLPGEFVWSVRWSPDGRRLVYIKAAGGRQKVESHDLQTGKHTEIMAAPGVDGWIRSLIWMPGARLVYSRAEAADVDANLWQVPVDPVTGAPSGTPLRLTRWTGVDLLGLSASSDGALVAVRKVTYPSQVYVGDEARNMASSPVLSRLTNNEAHDWATAWTADSKAVLFTSDRQGKWGIFKQELGQDAAQALVEGRERVDLARLSPDGAWVIYLETTTIDHKPHYRLMRVPVNGGLSHIVVDEGPSRSDDHLCARAPATLCATVEAVDSQSVKVVAFHPLQGRGNLLRTLQTGANDRLTHALSPDGLTLAVGRATASPSRIQLIALNGGADRDLMVDGLSNIESMEWSADGRGLYCGSTSSDGGTLFYVDRNGKKRVAWRSRDLDGGTFIGAVPSPDGRHLALTGSGQNTNAWLLDGIP